MTTPDDPHPGTAQLHQPFIELAVDSWRFARMVDRLLEKLGGTEHHRHANQLRYFKKRLDESLAQAGMSLVNLEGQRYDAGMAASALNLGDFGPEDTLVVDQMMEPVLMGPAGLLRSGTLLVSRLGGGTPASEPGAPA